ncbi:phospholipase D-like domain-containing protein [Nocardioides perillae]|uniref:Phospholipase D-like domain-containing protein n=1 Tax=Nocardioides perillae TaxID=1119534 RepID=A0A7Y9RWC7_9ACTN|nr:phosphatidylserine/phosphatidylglycerophosphate/cardiolipin synthase family protein [Nocardioides perillae]NYG55763.1 hypothetical protein [Nocardioides perillae]
MPPRLVLRLPALVPALVPALALVLAVGLGLTTAPTSAASATQPGGTPTGAGRAQVVFGEPGVPRIRRTLTALLRAAPAGATVRGVTWSFASRPLADELVRADRRGVTVRVLAGAVACREPAFRSLRSRLRAPSAARCVRDSARGRARFAGRPAHLHQKSWTATRSGGDRWVSVVTSANATAVADRAQWNDAVVVRGGRALHDRLAGLFRSQWRNRPVDRPFRRWSVGPGSTLEAGPWHSPRMTDPVLRRLAEVPARGARITVAHSNWQDARGERIARALAAKQRGGAQVRVLTSRPHSGRVRDLLAAAGIPQRSVWVGPRRYSHLKVVTAAWPTAGGALATRVWTGSENLWSPSRGHDELVLGLSSPAVHAAYDAFLDRLWRR